MINVYTTYFSLFYLTFCTWIIIMFYRQKLSCWSLHHNSNMISSICHRRIFLFLLHSWRYHKLWSCPPLFSPFSLSHPSYLLPWPTKIWSYEVFSSFSREEKAAVLESYLILLNISSIPIVVTLFKVHFPISSAPSRWVQQYVLLYSLT